MYMCVIQLFSVEHLQMSQCPICERYINLNADLYHTNIKAHTYIYTWMSGIKNCTMHIDVHYNPILTFEVFSAGGKMSMIKRKSSM